MDAKNVRDDKFVKVNILALDAYIRIQWASVEATFQAANLKVMCNILSLNPFLFIGSDECSNLIKPSHVHCCKLRVCCIAQVDAPVMWYARGLLCRGRELLLWKKGKFLRMS